MGHPVLMTPSAPDSVATSCYNCGAQLHGPFCAACGQQAQPLNPRLRDVVRDMAHELLDVDGKTVRSIRRLLFSPGFLTREYFEGRRTPWLPPLRLYLIFSVLYFAAAAIVPASGMRVHITSTGATQEERDTATARQLRKIGYNSEAELVEAVGRAWVRWVPRVMFVLVPLFALMVQIARRRDKRTYPQHLFFALHVHALWFAAGAAAAGVRLLAPDLIGQAARAVFVVYCVGYLAFAFCTTYGGTFRRGVAHAVVVGGVYWMSAALITLSVLLPSVFFHWW
jgi:hypothetical protein